MWIATSEDTRELDRRAHELGVPVESLMERAGQAVFSKVQSLLRPGSTIIVLCGKGNNGGDGLVVARLAHQQGFAVKTLVLAARHDLTGLPALQLERLEEVGLQPVFCTEGTGLADLSQWRFDLCIDAVLGTGVKGEPKGLVAEAIDLIRSSGWKVLSVDVPSGVETDTGTELGTAVKADWTVTFGLPKPFLFQGQGLELAGEWEVADIGFPEGLVQEVRSARLVGPSEMLLPRRKMDSHKGGNGHVLVLAGSRRYRGAASLAALGALKAGAGLVTVAAIEPVVEAVASRAPEAIFLPLPEADGTVDPAAADLIQDVKAEFSAAVIGPGLTPGPGVRRLLETLWRDWWVPTVVDADALNLVSGGVALPNGQCVLTPHPGEAARLLGADTAYIQSDRFRAARELRERYRCPVVLKGAYSIASLPEEPLMVNPTGNPGMATGGMGDVLAGVIASLLPDPFAAVAGTYWHGLAGDLCAGELGEIGFSASDLAQFLPRARSILSK